MTLEPLANALSGGWNEVADLGVVIFFLFVLTLLEGKAAPPAGDLEHKGDTPVIPIQPWYLSDDPRDQIPRERPDKKLMLVFAALHLARSRQDQLATSEYAENSVQRLVGAKISSQHWHAPKIWLFVGKDLFCFIQKIPVTRLLEQGEELICEVVGIPCPEIQRLDPRFTLEQAIEARNDFCAGGRAALH